MQEGRLFKIIYCLLEREQVTAQELADKFEVSVRTIYRDIDMISSAGIPIYATTGRNGGIKLYENFILNKVLLSEKNIQDILIGIQSLSAAQYPDYENTLAKLNAIFKNSNTNWIDVDFSRWGFDVQNDRQEFALLKDAILNRKKIIFSYYNSAGEASKRRCHPIRLIYKDKSWYLYGFCCNKKENRLFRITRMRNLTLTEEDFEVITDINTSAFDFSEDMGELIEIELNFPMKAAHRVFDIFCEEAITHKDERITVKTKLTHNEWLYEFILSFGINVDIVKPISLKNEIIKRCEEALQHHKERENEH